MKALDGDALRHYLIGDNDLDAAVGLLRKLTGGMLSGGFTLVGEDGVEVSVPSAVLAPLVDLLGILVTKRDGFVMVLDGYDEVSAHEAGQLLRVGVGTITQMLKDCVLQSKGRPHGANLRLPISEMLRLAGGRYDPKAKSWIMPSPGPRKFGPVTQWRSFRAKAGQKAEDPDVPEMDV